jgi:hypothetical protein
MRTTLLLYFATNLLLCLAIFIIVIQQRRLYESFRELSNTWQLLTDLLGRRIENDAKRSVVFIRNTRPQQGENDENSA